MILPGLLSSMDGSEAGLEPTDTWHDSTCALYATQQQLVACTNLSTEQPTNQPFNNKGDPTGPKHTVILVLPKQPQQKFQDSHHDRRLEQTSDNFYRGQRDWQTMHHHTWALRKF